MRVLIAISLFAFLIGVVPTVQAQTQLTDLSNEELYIRLSSTCSQDADLAATEFLRRGESVIEFLLAKKNDKNLFFGYFHKSFFETNEILHQPTNNMEYNKKELQAGDLRSMEIASLFLINAIFYQGFDFAKTPVLRVETKEGYPKLGNKRALIKKAWPAVDKWAILFRAQGLTELQRQRIAPLDLDRDGVDFY